MNRFARSLAPAAVALWIGAAAAATADGPAEVKAQWQAQKLDITYFGLTSRYTCDGIEGKVEQFLRAYGARKDMRIRASGCDFEPGHVSRTAHVTGAFQVLVPAVEAAGPETVAARWQPLELRPQHPFEMGEGDCELFEQLRPVLEKAFTQRDAHYTSRCTPYQVNLGSWGLKASVLREAKP
jgi:hypothetical protein